MKEKSSGRQEILCNEFRTFKRRKNVGEKEITAVMDSLIKSFQKEFNAELRG
jgi:phenylalanyl-tRNA synthetase beta chain